MRNLIRWRNNVDCVQQSHIKSNEHTIATLVSGNPLIMILQAHGTSSASDQTPTIFVFERESALEMARWLFRHSCEHEHHFNCSMLVLKRFWR